MNAQCSRVQGNEASVVQNPDGVLDFIDYPDTGSVTVLRCDIELDFYFTRVVEATFQIDPTDPMGFPDDNVSITSWGEYSGLTLHPGYFAFGTLEQIINNGNVYGPEIKENTLMVIPQTTLSLPSKTLRFECGQSNHGDFSISHITILVTEANIGELDCGDMEQGS
eukprot:UN34063